MTEKQLAALVTAFVLGYSICDRITGSKIKKIFSHMSKSFDTVIEEAVELLKLQNEALCYVLENSECLPTEVREELIRRYQFIEFAASHITAK